MYLFIYCNNIIINVFYMEMEMDAHDIVCPKTKLVTVVI